MMFENVGWIVVLIIFLVTGRQLMVISKKRDQKYWWLISLVYGAVCVASLVSMVTGFSLASQGS